MLYNMLLYAVSFPPKENGFYVAQFVQTETLQSEMIAGPHRAPEETVELMQV